MAQRTKAIRYVTDGTFSIDDVRRTLAGAGELVQQPSGEARFVPDDLSFPTTIFRCDGLIEVHVGPGAEDRLETYVAKLGSWLGVSLQRTGE